ncbi:MAG: AraC family transcriptional regulator ligand-binding domain-containing protein [Marmoricola sp.]
MVLLDRPASAGWDFPRSASGIALLLAFGAERDVSAPTLLSGTGLGEGEVLDPQGLVAARQELRVVRNLCGALGNPAGLGLEVGARYHATAFGILGYALLSSRTVLEAVNLALRFLDLSFIFCAPSVEVGEGVVRVSLDDAALPQDVGRFLAERDLAAICTVLGDLVPGGVRLSSVDVAFPRGDGRTLADLLGASAGAAVVRHGRPVTALAFPASELDRTLPQGNPQAVALAEALCRDAVSRRRDRGDLVHEVRVLLTQHVARGTSMEEVARALAMSQRTLRRRLAAAGTSYQRLLEEVRSSLARELLATGVLSVEDVAQRLGYAEASTFIVAFSRWQGTTPARYRRCASSRS